MKRKRRRLRIPETGSSSFLEETPPPLDLPFPTYEDFIKEMRKMRRIAIKDLEEEFPSDEDSEL